MTWRADDPQGDESAKIRHEIVPYVRGRCVDIGCGTEKVWPHFIGVDSFKDEKLFGIKVKADILADALDLDVFGSEQFDCVYSSHVLEHIEDTRAALREWWRLVKPGGTLILYLPHRDLYPRIGQPGSNPDHKHDFTPEDIIRAMENARGGFDLERNEVRAEGQEYSFLQVWRRRRDGKRMHSWKNPKPAKTAAIVRMGALGDAIWASSVISHIKQQGYHVTLYTQDAGEVIFQSDPNVDRIIVIPPLYDGAGLLAYFCYEEDKYDRFINLCGVVETRLLPASNEVEFWRPLAQRRSMFGGTNYLAALHQAAGLDTSAEYRQKFYATSDEQAWAVCERAKLPGKVAVINPNGSTIAKHWPHTQAMIDLLDAQGIHAIVLGDLRGERLDGRKYGKIVGLEWHIRKAMAFAAMADIVIGTESAIVNAVAFEAPLKIVLLSHSSAKNLTSEWPNTVAISPSSVDCHPCHRIHRTMEYCNVDERTGSARCQAIVDPEGIMDIVLAYLESAEVAQEAA
jgi:ADP-heptose:LPS heptosyltransferase/predicted SAM-dependent methyltransferase